MQDNICFCTRHWDSILIKSTDQYFFSQEIEKMKATLKGHKAEIDFDSYFVMSTIAATNFYLNIEFNQGAKEIER